MAEAPGGGVAGCRSMVLVEQIHGEGTGCRGVWLEKLNLDLFLVNLKLVVGVIELG